MPPSSHIDCVLFLGYGTRHRSVHNIHFPLGWLIENRFLCVDFIESFQTWWSMLFSDCHNNQHHNWSTNIVIRTPIPTKEFLPTNLVHHWCDRISRTTRYGLCAHIWPYIPLCLAAAAAAVIDYIAWFAPLVFFIFMFCVFDHHSIVVYTCIIPHKLERCANELLPSMCSNILNHQLIWHWNCSIYSLEL